MARKIGLFPEQWIAKADMFLFAAVSRHTKKLFSATSAWPEALEGRLSGDILKGSFGFLKLGALCLP